MISYKYQPITGFELRTMRSRMGLKQNELGELIGVSLGTICRYETAGDEEIKKTVAIAVRAVYDDWAKKSARAGC